MTAPATLDLVALVQDALEKRRAALDARAPEAWLDFILEVHVHLPTRHVDVRIRPPAEPLKTDAA